VGWLAKTGFVPLGYLGDEAKTERTFPVIDDARYSVPGDRAQYDDSGKMTLLGREAVTINSGGEKIFAEEVEQALKNHEGVYDSIVVGTPNERWGSQVTALILLREGVPPDEEALKKTASKFLAGYKLPKAYLYVDEIVRSPSGKADYAWAKERALAELARAANS
jgi:acyl-CoA synthetase (AMP-forming)/AMP-acid ligase II